MNNCYTCINDECLLILLYQKDVLDKDYKPISVSECKDYLPCTSETK